MDPTQAQQPIATVIEGFDVHLRDSCGAAEKTRAHYTRYAQEFLKAMNPSGLFDVKIGPTDLIKFVSDRAARCKPKTAKLVATALRSFLRFLQLNGLCDERIVNAVPTIPQWRLAELPRVFTDEQLQKLLASFDRSTINGRRGFAVTLCMTDLGLRAGEVARLSLDDIDWRAGTLGIRMEKVRRWGVLPMPVRVGRAIVAYLRDGRPPTSERYVFVRHVSPKGAPINTDVVKAIIRRAFERSGVDAPSRGTHILRHTAATRMIRQGASLKQIADVLRHRSLDTTIIYTKLDLPMLAEVAMPWPEVL